MVLELSTGSAVAAKALVQYANTVLKDTSQEPTSNQVFLAHSDMDIAACGLLLVLGAAVALWVKPLCVINNVLAVAGVLTVFAVVVVALLHVDADNWTDEPGFFPRGASGIMSASGTCLFAFVGYNVIATAAPETRRPCSTVATATTVTFVVGLLACFTVTVVITLVTASTSFANRAPLVHLLLSVRPLHGMGYFVAVGAVGSLLSASFAALFSLSRLLHFMAKEGFLLNAFATVSTSRGTPWISAVAGACLSAFMALVLDLHALVTVLGAGTGLAGATVASAILVHRYGTGQQRLQLEEPLAVASYSRDTTATSDLNKLADDAVQLEGPLEGDQTTLYGSMYRRQMSVEFANESFHSSLLDLENPAEDSEPTSSSWRKTSVAVAASGCFAAMLSWHVTRGSPVSFGERIWPEALSYLVVFAAIICLLGFVAKQPRRRLPRLMDAVPCVPLMPLVTLWLHVHLLVALHAPAWIRLLVWSVIGLIVRFLSLLFKVRTSCEGGERGSNQALLDSQEELVGLRVQSVT